MTQNATEFESFKRAHYIIYDPVSEDIYGISQSVFEVFGLSSDICYGSGKNSEFMISHLLPEVL